MNVKNIKGSLKFDSGQFLGYALWKQSDGFHLRWTTKGKKVYTFQGKIVCQKKLKISRKVRLETEDRINEIENNVIEWQTTSQNKVVGLNFRTPGNFTIELRINNKKIKPKMIFLGPEMIHPEKNPFTITCVIGEDKLQAMQNSKAKAKYEPTPELEPVYEPTPEPVYEPTSEPEPELEPKPTYKPTPEPEPESEPEPTYKSIPEPKPEPTYKNIPEPELIYEPTPELESEPIYEPTSEPKPEPEPTYKYIPEPEPKHTYESIPEPKPEPTYKHTPEPEQIYESTPEPELIYEPTPEPVYEPTSEPEPEPKPKPTLKTQRDDHPEITKQDIVAQKK
jgi:hypothetical protein